MNPASGARPPSPYTGVENLEVMREAKNYNRYLQSLVERNGRSARRVIDFGAGSGTFAIPCAAAGRDLMAVEPDERLRALLAQAQIRAVADIAELPDEAFEYAYTLNVLTLDLFLFRAVCANHLIWGFQHVAGFRRRHVGASIHDAWTISLEDVRASLDAAGFEVRTIRYADSLGFAATLLFKAIDNGRGDVNVSLLRLYDRLAFPVSRALDMLTHRWFGKNLLALATKPAP